MGTVILRQHNDLARSRAGSPTGLIKGELVTAPTTVTTTIGAAVDTPMLNAKTRFVSIEPTDCNIRYLVRPKRTRYTPVAATNLHSPIPAGAVIFEAVYPGAIISLLQVAAPTGAPSVFLPGYVPALGL